MSMLQLLFAGLVFVTVTGAAMIILLPLAPGRAERRLQSVAGSSGYAEAKARSGWTETVVKLAGSFAKLSLPSAGWEESPLRLRFMNAGYRGNAGVALFLGGKTILAALFPAIAYLCVILAGAAFGTSGLLVTLLCAAAAGYYLPNAVLSRLVLRRQREIFESFPDAADLMLVCVESGLGLDAALAKVTEELRIKSIALAEELHLVNLEMRAGGSRDRALRNLALRTGVEEVNSFVALLVQADRFGTSIGESLRVFSEESRTKRQLRAEELAAKIPLKLLFPLILCIFPSLLLVLLGPVFIQLYRTLLPTMAGN